MSEALIMTPAGEVAVKRAPTVYFIDDSATMREVIKIAFRRENINVITCADAASALAQFEQNRPDVVITDVIMPNQDGYAVCSQIKQHPEFGGIPVVLMSGVVNKSVADKMCRLHDMGIRHVATMHNFGGLDLGLVERSMTMFSREVMPRVASRVGASATA